jgi:hypothetical protein
MPNLDPRGSQVHSLQTYVAVTQLADRHAAAASARAARQARRGRGTITALAGDAVLQDADAVLRRASARDSVALARLAELDSAPSPTGEMLVAEAAGEIVAAVPVSGGRAIADPFRSTAGLVALLRDRAQLLAGGDAAHSRFPRLRPRLRTA